jgi:DNA-binding CsgD family transcriptional regulator
MSERGVRAGVFTFAGRDHAFISVELACETMPLGLTPAEAEVARLAAAGHSNAAISRARRVHVRTIANQLESIYRKLGIASRHELAARLYGSPT